MHASIIFFLKNNYNLLKSLTFSGYWDISILWKYEQAFYMETHLYWKMKRGKWFLERLDFLSMCSPWSWQVSTVPCKHSFMQYKRDGNNRAKEETNNDKFLLGILLSLLLW